MTNILIEPVRGFFDRYRFLSNFWPSVVTLADGYPYPSVEHAYQASKTTSAPLRKTIREASFPGTAKKMGRIIPLAPDWEDIKLTAMLGLLRQKFEDPGLRARLLETGDRELVEENNWGDIFWGVYRGEGKNHLGKLLMQVRAEIGPDPMEDNQIIYVHECATPGCDRLACTASEVGFAFYCCKPCALGEGHKQKCDERDPEQKSRVVPEAAAQPEDAEEYFAKFRKESRNRHA